MMSRLFFILLLFPNSLWAIQGEVELVQDSKQSFWLSEKIVVQLIIKTDAFAIQNLRVNTPTNNNVIIIKPDSAAYKTSVTINGTQWQQTVYEYIIYPMRSGEINLKSFQIQFSASMGYGQPQKTFNLKTQALNLKITKPMGLKADQFALTTKKMTLAVNYEPDIENLKVGDAFERTITISAEDVPDLLLQTVPSYLETGQLKEHSLKVYRSEPVLSETNVQGKMIATRIEKDTFVAQHESTVNLPEIAFYWFNPETQIIYTESIPEKNIIISGNPLSVQDNISNELDTISDKPLIEKYKYELLIIILVGTGLAFVIMRKWLKNQSVTDDEAIAFKQFEKACLKGNSQQIYIQFYKWAKLSIPQARPLTFKVISQQYPKLSNHLICLESDLTNQDSKCDYDSFLSDVRSIHNDLKLQTKMDNTHLISSINPI